MNTKRKSAIYVCLLALCITGPAISTGQASEAVIGPSGSSGRTQPALLGFTAEGRAVWSNGEISKYTPGEIAYSSDSGTNLNFNPLSENQWMKVQAGKPPYNDGAIYAWNDKTQLYQKENESSIESSIATYQVDSPADGPIYCRDFGFFKCSKHFANKAKTQQ